MVCKLLIFRGRGFKRADLTGHCHLEVFCQAAVSIEPGEGPFNDPSARQELEAVRRGAFDVLEGPVAEFAQGGAQVGAVIDADGKEMARPASPSLL